MDALAAVQCRVKYGTVQSQTHTEHNLRTNCTSAMFLKKLILCTGWPSSVLLETRSPHLVAYVSTGQRVAGP
eukprot:2402858-Rhodomonas_salina.1